MINYSFKVIFPLFFFSKSCKVIFILNRNKFVLPPKGVGFLWTWYDLRKQHGSSLNWALPDTTLICTSNTVNLYKSLGWARTSPGVFRGTSDPRERCSSPGCFSEHKGTGANAKQKKKKKKKTLQRNRWESMELWSVNTASLHNYIIFAEGERCLRHKGGWEWGVNSP